MAPKSEVNKQAEVINFRQVEVALHERIVDLQRALAEERQELRNERRDARKERKELRDELRAVRGELAELTLILHQVANQVSTLDEHQEEYALRTDAHIVDYSMRTDAHIVSTGSAFESMRASMYESRDRVLDALPNTSQTTRPDRRTVRSRV